MSSEVTIPDLPLNAAPPNTSLLEISNSGVSESTTIAQIVASGQTPWTQNIAGAGFNLSDVGTVQADQLEIINANGDNPTLIADATTDILEISGDLQLDGGSIFFGDHDNDTNWFIKGAADNLIFDAPSSGDGTKKFIISNPLTGGKNLEINSIVSGTLTELIWELISHGTIQTEPIMSYITEFPTNDDTGTIPVTSFISRLDANPATVLFRPLFEWFNHTTSVLSINAAGVVAFPQSPDIDDFTNSQHDHSDAVNGGQISLSAIALLSAKILVGNVSGVAADVFVGGEATMDNTGALTINDNAITLAKLATGTPGGLIGYDVSGDPTDVAAGTSGQVLTSNGTGLATFQTAGVDGIVTINGDGTADQVLVPTANRITIIDSGANHTFDVGSDVVVINAANIYGAFLQDFVSSNLRIPYSTTPTIAVNGDIGVDSDIPDFIGGVLEYWSTEALGVVAMPIAQFTTTPTDGHVVTYVAASDSFELGPVSTFSGDLSDLVIDADKFWEGKSITGLGLVNLSVNDTTAILQLEGDHASPVSQIIGQIDFIDDNNIGSPKIYGKIRTVIEDPQPGIEAAEMFFQVLNGSGSLVDFIVLNKTGSDEVEIGKTLNLDSNNVINSGTINSITIPATGSNFLTDTAVQNVQSKTFLGASPNKFENDALVIENPTAAFDYIVQSSEITATIAITLPLLLANDTFVFAAFIQNLTNKTLDNTNSITADAIDSGTLDNARLSAQVVLTDKTNTYGAFLQDFTSASLRIPVDNEPVTDTAGDFAFDDNVTEFTGGLIKFFISNPQGIVSMPIAQFTSPADGAIPTYNTTNNQFQMVVPTEFGDVSSVGTVNALSISVFTDAAGKTIDEGGTTLHPSIAASGEIIAPAPINFTAFAGTIPGTGDEFIVNVANNLIVHANSQVTLRVSGADEIQVTSNDVTLPVADLVVTAGDVTVTAGDLNMTDGNIVFADTDQEINNLHQIIFVDAVQTGTEADNAALNLDEGDYITWLGAVVGVPNFIRFTTTDVFNLSIGGTLVLSLNATDLQFPTAGTNILNINGLEFAESGNSQITGIASDVGIQVALETGDVFRVAINAITEYEFDDVQLALNGNGLEEIGMMNFEVEGTALTVTANAITITQTNHTVDTSVANQTVTTINGGTSGDVLILRNDDGTNNLVVDDGGNIEIDSNLLTLGSVNDILVLFYDGTNWLQTAFTTNG